MRSSFSWGAPHEAFEELIALAAVGEVSALEEDRLRRHIAQCQKCRDLYGVTVDVVLNDLGVLAADRQTKEPGVLEISESEARTQLRRLRISMETTDSRSKTGQVHFPYSVGSGKNPTAIRSRRRRYALYGIAATVLLGVTVAGAVRLVEMRKNLYTEQSGLPRLREALGAPEHQSSNVTPSSDEAMLRALEESQKTRDSLKKSLTASEGRNEELRKQTSSTEEKLGSSIEESEKLKQQLAASEDERLRMGKVQAESDAKLREALVELYQARQGMPAVAKNDARDNDGEATVESAAMASPSAASPTEAEARSLFGARDLHIVDVYDVKGDGKTKRTYGRVYYVEKKLLVFYAFDLQNGDAPSRRVFQAWGYREANVGKLVDLGLFAVDDKTVRRWVLKVSRAELLSRIDAVFVTVEPAGGSVAPRGKKILYANLVGPANHP